MATDGMTSSITFLYDDIQWGESAQVGFHRSDGQNFVVLEEPLNGLELGSNINIPGVFLYRVDGSEIQEFGEYHYRTGRRLTCYSYVIQLVNGSERLLLRHQRASHVVSAKK